MPCRAEPCRAVPPSFSTLIPLSPPCPTLSSFSSRRAGAQKPPLPSFLLKFSGKEQYSRLHLQKMAALQTSRSVSAGGAGRGRSGRGELRRRGTAARLKTRRKAARRRRAGQGAVQDLSRCWAGPGPGPRALGAQGASGLMPSPSRPARPDLTQPGPAHSRTHSVQVQPTGAADRCSRQVHVHTLNYRPICTCRPNGKRDKYR